MGVEKPLMGYDQFLMIALLRDGPLSLLELREKSILFISLIWYQQIPEKSQPLIEQLFFKLARFRSQVEDLSNTKKNQGTEYECEKLVRMGLINLNNNKFTLTLKGRREAQKFEEHMKKEAALVDNNIFQPSATARNTTILDFFLAIFKLGAGLVSGSVGLISDGVDNTMDTVSAFLVWLGIKYNRESLATIIVIFGLFLAAYATGSESISHILRALNGTLEPLTLPYLVIATEGIVLIVVTILFYYQRYVGRSFKNLTLIAQSVDNKNHIFISLSVIAGAVFALNGIYFVDAIIGLIISLGIFVDAIGLLRETISARKGVEDGDYSKYKLPLEQCWEENKVLAFRNWILYVIWAEKLSTSSDIIKSLNKAFDPQNYIPVISELKANCQQSVNFNDIWNDLIQPLVEHSLVIKEKEHYIITKIGEEHLKVFISNFEHYDVHLSDTILLAMAEDVKTSNYELV